jgi:hypothetical protein
MAKATPLTPDDLTPPPTPPTAATTPRTIVTRPVAPPSASPAAPSSAQAAEPPALPAAAEAAAPKQIHVPLQLRLPASEAKNIKRAALEAEQTISEFMLACFHAHMQAAKT